MWATGLVEAVTGIQPAPWFVWNSRIFIYSAYSKMKWPSQTKILIPGARVARDCKCLRGPGSE